MRRMLTQMDYESQYRPNIHYQQNGSGMPVPVVPQQSFSDLGQAPRDLNLDSALETSLRSLQPLPDEIEMQKRCIEHLGAAVQRLGSGWEMKVFGSLANGFATRGADLDITCFKHDLPEQDSQLAVQELKFELAPLLRQLPYFEVTKEVWSARVPIVRLKFMGRVDVDFSCHNPQAIQNTHLLHAYSCLNSKVRELVLSVKIWAKNEGLCGAPLGHLSSYSLTLMTIYFLQVVHAMPCLPTRCFSHSGYTSEVDMFTWEFPGPLSFLMKGFFRFYAGSFMWGSEVVSVSAGKRITVTDPRFLDLPGKTVARLHIEDPFLPRNLNCVLNIENEQVLRMKIQEASETIHMGQVPQAFVLACSNSELPQNSSAGLATQVHWQTGQHWNPREGVVQQQPQDHGGYNYPYYTDATEQTVINQGVYHSYPSRQNGSMPHHHSQHQAPLHVGMQNSQRSLAVAWQQQQQGNGISHDAELVHSSLKLEAKKTRKWNRVNTDVGTTSNGNDRSSDARIHSEGESTCSGSITDQVSTRGNPSTDSLSRTKFSSVRAWLEAGLKDLQQ
eukprot:TRINITY_DN91666_c0_g1_i1.p1 TRINITY_DN91666_c0_g1~~TRINITY_DN91666_c0_g1_i1.p1  ORF type:complete len:557 (+),score=80.93 TRINITY_DN91666_c0_g1_i1:166-1836(+)